MNGLDGEAVSIIPNVKKTTLAQIYEAIRKDDFLIIIEQAQPRALGLGQSSSAV